MSFGNACRDNKACSFCGERDGFLHRFQRTDGFGILFRVCDWCRRALVFTFLLRLVASNARVAELEATLRYICKFCNGSTHEVIAEVERMARAALEPGE